MALSRSAFIRHRVQSFTARWLKSRSGKPRRFIRAVPTRAARPSHSTRWRTIAKPTECTPRTAFCSITKARAAAKPFVTRKITRALARILAGKDKKLYLGNLDAKRDWGYAKDYVEAMWLMLQQDEPDDYVIATGESWSVREFLDRAFSYVKLDWKDYVEFDERYLRPSEVDLLIGDASKARTKLGWTPTTGFDELVKIMVDADIAAEKRDPNP